MTVSAFTKTKAISILFVLYPTPARQADKSIIGLLTDKHIE